MQWCRSCTGSFALSGLAAIAGPLLRVCQPHCEAAGPEQSVAGLICMYTYQVGHPEGPAPSTCRQYDTCALVACRRNVQLPGSLQRWTQPAPGLLHHARTHTPTANAACRLCRVSPPAQSPCGGCGVPARRLQAGHLRRQGPWGGSAWGCVEHRHPASGLCCTPRVGTAVGLWGDRGSRACPPERPCGCGCARPGTFPGGAPG